MDSVIATLITGLVAGVGVGSVLTAAVQHVLKRSESAHESRRKDLEARYRVIVLLMYAAYDFKPNQTGLQIHRPDLKTKEAVIGDLWAEWHNMTLFASAKALDALREFLVKPEKLQFQQAVLAMREDLGRGRIDFKL